MKYKNRKRNKKMSLVILNKMNLITIKKNYQKVKNFKINKSSKILNQKKMMNFNFKEIIFKNRIRHNL